MNTTIRTIHMMLFEWPIISWISPIHEALAFIQPTWEDRFIHNEGRLSISIHPSVLLSVDVIMDQWVQGLVSVENGAQWLHLVTYNGLWLLWKLESICVDISVITQLYCLELCSWYTWGINKGKRLLLALLLYMSSLQISRIATH